MTYFTKGQKSTVQERIDDFDALEDVLGFLLTNDVRMLEHFFEILPYNRPLLSVDENYISLLVCDLSSQHLQGIPAAMMIKYIDSIGCVKIILPNILLKRYGAEKTLKKIPTEFIDLIELLIFSKISYEIERRYSSDLRFYQSYQFSRIPVVRIYFIRKYLVLSKRIMRHWPHKSTFIEATIALAFGKLWFHNPHLSQKRTSRSTILNIINDAVKLSPLAELIRLRYNILTYKFSLSNGTHAARKLQEIISNYECSSRNPSLRDEVLGVISNYTFQYVVEGRTIELRKHAEIHHHFIYSNPPFHAHRKIIEIIALHFHIGFSLLASSHYLEAKNHLKILLKNLRYLLSKSPAIGQQLPFLIHVVEASLYQCDNNHSDFILSVKLVIQELDDLERPIDRFLLRINKFHHHLHKTSVFTKYLKKRLLSLLRILIKFSSSLESSLRRYKFNEEDYDNYLYLKKSLQFLHDFESPNGINVRKKELTQIKEIAESRNFKFGKNNGSHLRHCNMGHVLIPGFHMCFIQYHEILLNKYKFSAKNLEKFVAIHRSILSGSFKEIKNPSPENITIALHLIDQAIELGERRITSGLFFFSLHSLNQSIRKSSYLVITGIFDILEMICTSIQKISPLTDSDLITSIKILDEIFFELEYLRGDFLEENDQSTLEMMLTSLYGKYANVFFALYQGENINSRRRLLIEALLVYTDRSRLRWTRSLRPTSLIREKRSDSNCDSLATFVLKEERIHHHMRRNSWIDFSSTSTENRIKTTRKALHRLSRDSSISSDTNLKAHCEDFEYLAQDFENHLLESSSNSSAIFLGYLKQRFVPVADCLLSNPENPQIHIRELQDAILVIVSFRSKFRVFQLSEDEADSIRSWIYKTIQSTPDISLWENLLQSHQFHNVHFRVLRFLYKCKPRRELSSFKFQFFVDPHLSAFPFHSVFRSLGFRNCTHSPSITLSARSVSIRPSPRERVVLLRTSPWLPFGKIEENSCWEEFPDRISLSSDFERSQLSPDKLVESLRTASVFHLIGHLSLNGNNISLTESGLFRLDMEWCLRNIILENAPLVMINTCHSASALGPKKTRSFQKLERYHFREEMNTDSASFASVFLSLGASSVIATIQEVDDFVAALFGWRFSNEASRRGLENVEDCFSRTLSWLQALDDKSEIFPFVEAVVAKKLPQDGLQIRHSMYRAFHSIHDSEGFGHIRHWSPFVLYSRNTLARNAPKR